jgi:hypothetical protein
MSDQENPPAAPAVRAPHESDREELRVRHGVRLVDSEEEGAGVARLPAGVYGFTYAPHAESPLFRNRPHHSYEVHKLATGEMEIVGFLTPSEAQRLDRIEEVTLFPDPWEQAATFVSLPKSRILKTKGPSRDEGNGMKLMLLPSAEIN